MQPFPGPPARSRPRQHAGVRASARSLLLVLLLVLTAWCGAGAAGAVIPGATPDTVPVGGWPLRPVPAVVRGFDPPDSPWGSGHRGVDLLGTVAQPVLAALPGTVTFAGPLAGRGVVVVDHGGTRTTYEPVAAGVHVGDAVPTGGRLGALQPGGSHCAPRACLHWGWLRGDTYLDPLLLVGAGPVRLLPLWREQPVDAGPVAARAALRPPVEALDWRPVLPYAAWRPPSLSVAGPGALLVVGQARGCACW